MKSRNVFGALVFFGMLSLAISVVVMAQQQVSITTFYPAPFGDYARLFVSGDADPTSDDLAIGEATAGAITREGQVRMNGNVTIGQPGDAATQNRNLTVSGNVTVGDTDTTVMDTVQILGRLRVDDNFGGVPADVTQHDVTIGSAATPNAVLNVNGSIRVNNAQMRLPAPQFASVWTGIGPPFPATATFTHNFGTTEYMVYIEGRAPAGSVTFNQWRVGGDRHTNLVGTTLNFGAYWHNKDINTVQVTRESDDTQWVEVRVLCWCWAAACPTLP